MKLRKNWKRFWTLNRHHAEGFTLVELIVVIAILAILGGVAVPAYSGYVKKANMQADMTLISEIEHALTLAGYNGTFADGEGGYLVLSTEGVSGVTADSSLEKALIDTFGTSYADTLKLSYDGWAENSSMLSFLIGTDESGNPNNTYEEIVNVANSSFLTGNTTDELMSNVENLTTKLAGIVEGMGQDSKNIVYGMFSTTNGTNALQTVMKDQGYLDDEGDPIWDNVDATTLSNLVVLAAAEEMKNMDSAAIMGGAAPSSMANYVTNYALYTAYAANENSSQTYKDKYAQLQKDIQSETDAGAIIDMLDTFSVNLSGDGANIPADSGWTAYEAGSWFKDIDAFSDIMNAVDNADIAKDDLSDGTLFTQGTINTLFGSYVSSVDMISGMTPEIYQSLLAAQGDGISMIYSYDGSTITVNSSLRESN